MEDNPVSNNDRDDAELSPLARRRRVSDKSDLAEIDLLASDLDDDDFLPSKSNSISAPSVLLTQKQLCALSVRY